MTTEETRRLADRAAEGDERAFAELVRAHSRVLYAASRAILRSDHDAQDCVQEAILRGWQRLRTLRDRRYFGTWLTRIAVNTALNMLRKRRPSAQLPEDIPGGGALSPEQLDIRRAVEALDERSRLLTVLYYFEDLSIAEIARATGLREGTIKSRLSRARATLRTTLEDYNHES